MEAGNDFPKDEGDVFFSRECTQLPRNLIGNSIPDDDFARFLPIHPQYRQHYRE